MRTLIYACCWAAAFGAAMLHGQTPQRFHDQFVALMPLRDSAQAEAALALARQAYAYGWMDSAMVAAKAVERAAAGPLASLTLRAKAANVLGVCFFTLGRHDSARAWSQRAGAHWRVLGDSLGEAMAQLNIANVAFATAEYAEAADAYARILAALRPGHNPRHVTLAALCYLNGAAARRALGQHAEAITSLTQARQMFEAMGDTARIAAVYNNLGAIYSDLKQDSQAMRMYGQAIRLLEATDAPLDLPVIYNNMSSTHYVLGQFGEAAGYALKAAVLLRQSQNPVQLAFVYLNLGRVYLGKQDFGKTRTYLQKAMTLYDSLGNAAAGLLCQTVAAEALMAQRDWGAAAQLLARIRAQADTSQEFVLQIRSLRMQAECARHQGRPRQARNLEQAREKALATLQDPEVARQLEAWEKGRANALPFASR